MMRQPQPVGVCEADGRVKTFRETVRRPLATPSGRCASSSPGRGAFAGRESKASPRRGGVCEADGGVKTFRQTVRRPLANPSGRCAASSPGRGAFLSEQQPKAVPKRGALTGSRGKASPFRGGVCEADGRVLYVPAARNFPGQEKQISGFTPPPYFSAFSSARLNCAMSLGETPGMRPAWASVRGRMRRSFSRASSVIVSMGS